MTFQGSRTHSIFYETRGIIPPLPGPPPTPATPGASRSTSGTTSTTSARAAITAYQAEFSIDERWFSLDGYYRTSHYHWGDEGDFFGLYPDANYGPNLDLYNGIAPFGLVAAGKREFDGLKVAFGPQLYWGGNPAVLAKYRREIGPVAVTAMYQEDIAANTSANTSAAIPDPVARKATLHIGLGLGKVQIGIGGIMSSPQQVGREFFWTRPTVAGGYLDSGYEVLKDTIKCFDTLGGKAKIVIDGGVFRAYAEGQFRGLVANGGPDTTSTLTHWSLKDSGRGNQASGIAGFTVDAGHVQIGPQILYQKPIIGPMPAIGDHLDPLHKTYSSGFKARNVIDAPFAVLDNRETLAGELLIVYDPTPATWYGSWDRELREDARIAGNIDFVYRHQPTARDASIGILANGSSFAFHASPPAHDTWDLKMTWVSNPARAWKLSYLFFLGQGQARGDDARLVTRYGGSFRVTWDRAFFTTSLLLHDWGPYDYHRDFNLTYPFQLYGDISYGLHLPMLKLMGTRLGLHWQFRTLNEHSENYVDDPLCVGALGSEYELRTYVHVSM